MTALTAICRHENCRKPYGDHAQYGSWCPTASYFSRTQKFSEDFFGEFVGCDVDGDTLSRERDVRLRHASLRAGEEHMGATARRTDGDIYQNISSRFNSDQPTSSSLHGLCRDVLCNRLECQRDLGEHQQEVLAEERYQQLRGEQ